MVHSTLPAPQPVVCSARNGHTKRIMQAVDVPSSCQHLIGDVKLT